MSRTNVLLPITDPRMMSLICATGAEGYAVYTSFLMLAAESPSIPLGPAHIKTLSTLLQMDQERTAGILDTLASPALGSLVVKTEEGYLSAQLMKAESRSEKRRQAASKRWNKNPEEETGTAQDDNLQCTFAMQNVDANCNANLQCKMSMQNVDANCNANVQNDGSIEPETSKSSQSCEENTTHESESAKEGPKEKRSKKEIPQENIIHPSIQGLVLSSAGEHVHAHVEELDEQQDSTHGSDSGVPDGRTDGPVESKRKSRCKKPIRLAERVIISDIGYAQLLETYPEAAVKEAAGRLDDGLASGKLAPSASTFRRLKAFLEGMDERGEIYRMTTEKDHGNADPPPLMTCPTCGGRLTPSGECHGCRTVWSRDGDGYSSSPMADEEEMDRRRTQLDELLKRHPVVKRA